MELVVALKKEALTNYVQPMVKKKSKEKQLVLFTDDKETPSTDHKEKAVVTQKTPWFRVHLLNY